MVRFDDDLFAIEAVSLVEGSEVGFDVDGIGDVGAEALRKHDGGGGDEGAGRAELDVFFGLLRIVIEGGEVGDGEEGDDVEHLPVAVGMAGVVVGENDGGIGVVGVFELGVAGGAAKSSHGGDILRGSVPLGGCDADGKSADDDLIVVVVGGLYVAGEFAVGVERGIGGEIRGEGPGRGGGRGGEFGGRAGGDEECFLVANLRDEITVGRYGGRAVEPDAAGREFDRSDDVIADGR
jgi:hypothetical protein